MATDRNQIRREYTLDELWAFIRERVERQREARKRFTLHFEVSVDYEGRITTFAFQPAKELPEVK